MVDPLLLATNNSVLVINPGKPNQLQNQVARIKIGVAQILWMFLWKYNWKIPYLLSECVDVAHAKLF